MQNWHGRLYFFIITKFGLIVWILVQMAPSLAGDMQRGSLEGCCESRGSKHSLAPASKASAGSLLSLSTCDAVCLSVCSAWGVLVAVSAWGVNTGLDQYLVIITTLQWIVRRYQLAES